MEEIKKNIEEINFLLDSLYNLQEITKDTNIEFSNKVKDYRKKITDKIYNDLIK